MDISGTYTLNAPRERVWDALLDPDMLQRTIPGCEKLEPIGPDEWRMRVNIGIAAVKGSYEGTLRMTEQVAPEHYRLVADGTGARSVLHGDGTLTLEATDPNTTVVNYKGEVQINGPLAGIANRVAGSVSRMLVNQLFGRMQKELAGDAASTTPLSAPEVESAAHSAAAPASAPDEDAVFDASTSGVWEMSLPEARPLDDEQMPTAALPLEAAPAATEASPAPATSTANTASSAPVAPASVATAATVTATPLDASPAAPAPAAPAASTAVASSATASAASPSTVATQQTSATSSPAATSTTTPPATRGGFMGWFSRLFGRTS